MKITIDTNEDNPEHIKHLCNFLLNFANNTSSSVSSNSSTSNVDTSSMMNMFDDNQTSNSTPAEKAPDFGAFLSLTKNYEKKESGSKPQIEFL